MSKTTKYLLTIWCAALWLFVATAGARAQTASPSPTPAAPPASDIYIVDIQNHHNYKNATDTLKFADPKKITDLVGYNNQPSFTPDGKSILYTSTRNKQTDIYRYDLETGKTTQVTD